jgi:hypothetical protein
MTTTITIKDKPVNATYQNVTGLTGGAGVDAVFDVVKTNGVYTASLDSLAASAGSGYVAGDTITIAGTALGGTAPANNLILTVATVGAAGKIATFGAVGTGRVGDGTVDVAVDVTGTAGVDTYTLNGDEAEFTITKTDDAITAVSTVASNVTFTLEDHERVVFDDTAIAFDADGVAGDVYALLAAALGESDVTAEYEGIGIYLADNGWTNTQLAEALLATDTYKTDAGGVSETFIKHVYKNVMGTDATLADVTGLTNWMTANDYSQADVLVIASQLEDFQTDIDLVGLATTGIEYTPFVV